MRDLIPDNYETFGTQWSTLDINRYNAIQERINAFHGRSMPVPEHLLLDSFNIVNTYMNLQGETQ